MQYDQAYKKTEASTTVQAKSLPQSNAAYLQDNRPQRMPQQHVFQLRSAPNNATVIQLGKTTTGKTVSGHGKLHREKNKIKTFKVPKGKTIMRPAPPGATLGNLSMLLNEKKGLTRKQLLKKMKVSTTKDLWGNKGVVKIIKNNTKISKTKKQDEVLEKLLKSGYDKLTGPEKTSLARLESKEEFEKWSEKHVKKETFKTFKGGEDMEDMDFTSFEPSLQSKTPHSENEYVSGPTNLSQYVNTNNTTNDFVVNACSWDENSPYTGFQIDKK